MSNLGLRNLTIFLTCVMIYSINCQNIPCTTSENGRLFDLKPLDSNLQYTSKKNPIAKASFDGKDAFNAYIVYNICKNTAKIAECTPEEDSTAFLLYTEEADVTSKVICKSLTRTSGTTEKKSVGWENKIDQIKDGDKKD
jgi:hypothetical protein